ncbi:MAG: hypothetical protein AAGJ79_05430 [Verrucomicrobiota bacterium]
MSDSSIMQRTSPHLLLICIALGPLSARAQAPPDLGISQDTGGDIILSWSTADSEWVRWYPETSLDLKDPWEPITATQDRSENRFCLELELEDTLRHFRLARSPIFFVDDSQPTAGAGTLADPYQTIALGLNAAKQSFIADGRRPVVYVFAGDYSETLSIDASGAPGYELTLMDSSTPIEVNGMTVGGFGQTARLETSNGSSPLSVTGLHGFALLGFEVRSLNAHCIDINSVEETFFLSNDLEPTNGNGFLFTNSNVQMDFPSVGVFDGDGEDGIEIINNDGNSREALIQNGNFGFGLSSGNLNGTLEHGIKLTAASGQLDAEIVTCFIVSQRETIITTDGGQSQALLLDLVAKSPLTTTTPGVPTQSITGSALHSTIIRKWQPFNQVTGSILQADEPGGLRFDRVTFDAEGNPSNGITQVVFGGTLDIGSVPPSTVTRVVGPGLAFPNCTGDLRIDALNIANRGAPAVDNSGSSLTLDIGSSTIDTVGN